jgi:hypothetical protein
MTISRTEAEYWNRYSGNPLSATEIQMAEEIAEAQAIIGAQALAPDFTPRKATAGQRATDGSTPIWWTADIINGARIHLLPRPAGYQITVTEVCSTGESYGMFPTLEVAYLEACVIYADIIQANA